MRSVHKFTLIPGQQFDVYVSKGAKVLLVAEQHGEICMWMECDPNVPHHNSDMGKGVHRSFRVFGTGHPIDDFVGMHIEHVGSAVCAGGQIIWHVYEAWAKKDVTLT